MALSGRTVMPAISTRHVLSDEKPEAWPVQIELRRAKTDALRSSEFSRPSAAMSCEVLTADIAPSQMTPMNFFERTACVGLVVAVHLFVQSVGGPG